MGLLYGTSMVMHVIICVHGTWNIAVRRLYELPRTAHTRLLCNITIYHISNITLNVDLLSLLTMQPNHVTRMLSF